MIEKKKTSSASVRAKLLNKSRETGEELQNLLMRFAAERLLYRLSRSEHKDKFLLKGAALFVFWFDQPHRPTKDLDLLGFGASDIPTLEKIVREICAIEGEDGLQFLAESVKGETIREDGSYGGIRSRLTAMLERARIPLQVDVDFGDAVTPRAEEEALPTILDSLAPELIALAHDCSGFSCGKPPLNKYIKKYALINQENEISRTYVTIRESRVVGYYSLAFGSISHEDGTQKIKDELPQYPIPIILLARLAVDVREKGHGLGKGLLRDAMLRTIQAADIAGLRAMLTHAKDEAAKSFYEKHGFESSPSNELHLMLSIKDIRANLI